MCHNIANTDALDSCMKTNGLISVVVPVRNRANIVLRTLDSIACQTFRPLHLIIVDNNSTDSTLETITDWARKNRNEQFGIEILQCNKPGAPQARNYGLATVTTPWVMFFDSDDEMRPQHIEKIAHEIQENPDCDLIYFDAAELDSDGWTNPMSVNDNDVMRGHLFHCSLSTQRMAINTNLIKQIGGWRNECKIWDDMELGVRLLLNTTNVRKLHGDPMVLVHPHDADSITGVDYRSRAGLFENTLDIIDSQFQSPEQGLQHMWVECRRVILAAIYMRENETQRAKALLHGVLSRHNWRTRLKLRMVYIVQKLLGRGGSATSTLLFKPTKAKAK